MKTNGEKIKLERERLGLTQDKLAKMSGLTRQTIINLEKDLPATFGTISKLAEIFKISAKDLVI